MENKKNTTMFETVPKSNRIIVDRGKIDTSHTKLLHDRSFSWLGIGTSIKSGRVKLLFYGHKFSYEKSGS